MLLLLLIPGIAFGQPRIAKELRQGYESIAPQTLRSHLTVLTSDSLEGRETSFPGGEKAAAYIADVFKNVGLLPIGDKGTYFQNFNVDLVKPGEQCAMTVTTNGGSYQFQWLKEYAAFGAPETTITGPAVFVGHLDFKPDERTAERMKGRIVITLASKRGAPIDTATGSVRRRILQFRSDPGALGTLVVGDASGAGTFDRLASVVRGFADGGTMRIAGTEGRTSPSRSLFFYIADSLADLIVRTSGVSLAQLRSQAADSLFTPVFLDSVTIRIHHELAREVRSTKNVIGLLPGSDPLLRNQYVFFSAHYDHLGRSRDRSIFRGADDDGSGTSMVLALAGAYAKNRIKPKRGLVFLCVTGEEKGLLGSGYYTSHPLLPLDSTMADFNIDMIGRTDPHHDSLNAGPYVYLIGSDKISTGLDQVLREANRESEQLSFDYTYNDDKDPNQYYRRSDHYNFAKRGVPIAFFFTGEHKDYHKVTDTIDKILFDRMAKIGHVIYLAGWKAASQPMMFEKDGEGGGYR